MSLRVGRVRGRGRGRSQGRSNNFQGSNFQKGSNSLRRSQSERPQNQNNQTGRDMSQIICRRCNRVGHFVADCRTSNNKLPKYKQPSNSAQYANDSNQGKHEDESGFEFVFSLSNRHKLYYLLIVILKMLGC